MLSRRAKGDGQMSPGARKCMPECSDLLAPEEHVLVFFVGPPVKGFTDSGFPDQPIWRCHLPVRCEKNGPTASQGQFGQSAAR
jgi:hypothetical protein